MQVNEDVWLEGDNRVDVSIAICTRQRPEMLSACLESVLAQASICQSIIKVIVVENDNIPASKELVSSIFQKYPQIEGHYTLETTLGLVSARNRAVEEALKFSPKWLGFIDDDEIAEPGWLDAMIRAGEEFESDVLVGPVKAWRKHQAPIWVKLKKPKKPHGKSLPTCATNNTFVKAHWFSSLGKGLRFDPSFTHSGGEDRELFYRLADEGGSIRWVQDALVSELVVPERDELSYYLERTRGVASNSMRIDIKRFGHAEALARRLPQAFCRFIGGALVGAIAWPLAFVSRSVGERLKVKGAKDLVSAMGSFDGFKGVMLDRYKTVQGE